MNVLKKSKKYEKHSSLVRDICGEFLRNQPNYPEYIESEVESNSPELIRFFNDNPKLRKRTGFSASNFSKVLSGNQCLKQHQLELFCIILKIPRNKREEITKKLSASILTETKKQPNEFETHKKSYGPATIENLSSQLIEYFNGGLVLLDLEKTQSSSQEIGVLANLSFPNRKFSIHKDDEFHAFSVSLNELEVDFSSSNSKLKLFEEALDTAPTTNINFTEHQNIISLHIESSSEGGLKGTVISPTKNHLFTAFPSDTQTLDGIEIMSEYSYDLGDLNVRNRIGIFASSNPNKSFLLELITKELCKKMETFFSKKTDHFK